MNYSIANGWKWITDKEAVRLCEKINLKPQHRLLLLSDSSLTRFLETFNQSPIDVEIIKHETHKIEKKEAEYLEVDISQDAIIRDVWLIQKTKKLVYAHSVFPLAGLDRHWLEKISLSIEPLGKSLTKHGLMIFKDKLEICAVTYGKISNILDLPAQTLLWAKHYRLFAQPLTEGRCFTASITEIFSHELLGSPPPHLYPLPSGGGKGERDRL